MLFFLKISRMIVDQKDAGGVFFFSCCKCSCSLSIHQRVLGFNSTMLPPQHPSIREQVMCQGSIAAYPTLQESPLKFLGLTFMSEHRSTHSILHVESTLHAHSLKKEKKKEGKAKAKAGSEALIKRCFWRSQTVIR